MRKRMFKAALALADRRVVDFASEQGVTPAHLYAVLSGERESVKLLAAVDAFIAEHISVPRFAGAA